MRRLSLILVLPFLLCSCAAPGSPVAQNVSSFSSPTSVMELTSSAFPHGGALPSQYSCDGAGINPPLSIAGVPQDAGSLALIVDDPDAPSGTFIHWNLWDIPPAVTGIPGGSVPEGATEGRNSVGEARFFPPCPPSGTHRYRFTLFALDAPFASPSALTPEDARRAMQGHILAEAQLVGLYRRI